LDFFFSIWIEIFPMNLPQHIMVCHLLLDGTLSLMGVLMGFSFFPRSFLNVFFGGDGDGKPSWDLKEA
jgi:hypothetical protein